MCYVTYLQQLRALACTLTVPVVLWAFSYLSHKSRGKLVAQDEMRSLKIHVEFHVVAINQVWIFLRTLTAIKLRSDLKTDFDYSYSLAVKLCCKHRFLWAMIMCWQTRKQELEYFIGTIWYIWPISCQVLFSLFLMYLHLWQCIHTILLDLYLWNTFYANLLLYS